MTPSLQLPSEIMLPFCSSLLHILYTNRPSQEKSSCAAIWICREWWAKSPNFYLRAFCNMHVTYLTFNLTLSTQVGKTGTTSSTWVANFLHDVLYQPSNVIYTFLISQMVNRTLRRIYNQIAKKHKTAPGTPFMENRAKGLISPRVYLV